MRRFILFYFFFLGSSVIFRDQGQYLFQNGPSFICQNNYQTTRTITFSGTFQNIPKVFFYQDKFDLPSTPTEYQFSITSITLNDFQIFFKCPLAGIVYAIYYQWIALDDQRIQVINAFNLDPPEDKVFNHQLLNAETARVGFTSLGYTGQIDFYLSITGLTSNTVSIGITKVAGKFVNLKQIGYQILIVASRDITDVQSITFNPTYQSNAITLQSNKWLIIPFQGVKYVYSHQLRMQEIKTYDSTTVTIKFENWGGAYSSELSVKIIWLSYQPLDYYALECPSLRISQKLDISQPNRPTFFVKIVEKDQIYNTDGQYSFRVNKPTQLINLVVEVKCIKGKRVISKFNKCNSCPSNQKYHKFNHYCHSQINLISYFPRFTQIQLVNQEFSLIITDTNCILKQILYNQVKEEQDVMNIEFQDS